MTAKDIKSKVEIGFQVLLEQEWKIRGNHNGTYTVSNEYVPEKWADFSDLREAIRYFKGKASYLKRVFKAKNITRELEYNIF